MDKWEILEIMIALTILGEIYCIVSFDSTNWVRYSEYIIDLFIGLIIGYIVLLISFINLDSTW